MPPLTTWSRPIAATRLGTRRGHLPGAALGPTRRRRRWRRARSWPVTALLALVAGTVTATTVGRAEDARQAFGEPTSVPVATRDLEPGHEVGPDDVAWRDRPPVAVPATPARDPVGRVAASRILAGEPLVDARLAPTGRRGPLALAPPGTSVVALPVDAPHPPLVPGDRLDLLEAAPALPGDVGLPVERRWVARGAVVLDVGDTAIAVAVAAEHAAATATAALEGTLALVVALDR